MAGSSLPERRQPDSVVAAALHEVAMGLQNVRTSLDSLSEQIPHLKNEVDERVDEAIREASAAIEAADKILENASEVEARMSRRGLLVLFPLTVILAIIVAASAVGWSVLRGVEDSTDRNHVDHERTEYLFCEALKNAGLPYPPACEVVFKRPPPDFPTTTKPGG
jgi:hypothetical protein